MTNIQAVQPGMHVLVMGLAKSGEAVTRLLLTQGVRVIVNERRPRNETEYEADALEELGATVVFGGHPFTLLDDNPLDFIVKNPGIPYSVPLLQEAGRRQIPIYTEIEVATWLTEAPIYAITGSNGKTTTTTVVGEILNAANQNPMVAGNIGRVLSGVVTQVAKDQPIVLEVSSFQLMGTRSFHPRIAALLNLYPAHLDYHETMDAYFDAKWKIFDNMTEQDVAVLNYDQSAIRARAATLKPAIAWFSRLSADIVQGVCVDEGYITLVKGGTRIPLVAVSTLAQKGEHNLENALAATAMAVWAGAPTTAIEHVLTRFRGVEHRTEFVASIEGIDYYNDSKATNPQAALRALRGFTEGIVWIAGGLDRGDDFSVLVPEIQKRVKAAILLGQSAPMLANVCRDSGVVDVNCVATLDEAILASRHVARAGDVVLLSPACASWDMFTSFEERGSMFKDAVHRL